MHQENMEMLWDTLNILKRGFYLYENRIVKRELSLQQMEEIKVFLPEDIQKIPEDFAPREGRGGERLLTRCVNRDAFSLARKIYREGGMAPKQRILVLNLANPVHPGGGVRKGAKAQEEDLCRQSSLLLSLESQEAEKYYAYNRGLHSDLGSHAVMISPQVEIVKNNQGKLLNSSVIVSVMTCAAPNLREEKNLDPKAYRQLMLERIRGMLKVAAFLGYRCLVLGAFGCGAFQNDGALVSDFFFQAMKDLRLGGLGIEAFFDRIDFAVLDHTKEQYNFQEFSRNFDNFYRLEDEAELKKTWEMIKGSETYLDKIRGCLMGGAAGDALGYRVEFLQEEDIQEKYGRAGIQSYDLDPATGKALISDDTQMTMFTANGVLVGQTQRAMRGTKAALSSYVELAYQDWFKTQTESMEERKTWKSSISWLLDVPGLYARRAPGNTCLSALSQGITGSEYIRQAKNHSKGCGGLIRVAPLALACRPDRGDFKGIETLDREGAQIAAITHGHSLGYMPAAVLTHILSQILTHPQADLKSIVLEAREMVQKLFPEDAHLPELVGIMDLALELSANDKPDVENIHALGEGWEAEETLGIALYCALKYEKDFSAGIIAAVNHNGDSDSTGSVTGNILGALLGYERMEAKWKEHLELSEVILELADDLCHGCQMSEHGHYADPVWVEKYRNMHRYTFLGYDKYVFFWKAKEEYGEFSNWYSSPFVFEDFEYQHLEQYMMARKAKLFHDAKRYTRILRADSPRECKDLGREVAGFSEDIWNEEKFEIVKEGLREKFTQNPGLLKKLLATGERILVEASPLDRIWGIGLDEKNAKRTPPQDWPGENLLGKALMELRRELENGK